MKRERERWSHSGNYTEGKWEHQRTEYLVKRKKRKKDSFWI